jgi:MFS family permease
MHILLQGTLFAVNAIPCIIFSPFAGVLVDRISKKKAVIISDIGRGLIVFIRIDFCSSNYRKYISYNGRSNNICFFIDTI